jgi:hypothetical protein
MKKIICMIIGHNLKTEQCPVTGAKLTMCLRCSPQIHSSKMSFK